jgi:hypothetical protein
MFALTFAAVYLKREILRANIGRSPALESRSSPVGCWDENEARAWICRIRSGNGLRVFYPKNERA